MNTFFLSNARYTLFATVLLAVGLTVGHPAAYASVVEDEPEVAADVSALEAAFWRCDHAATRHGVELSAGAACGALTDEFKMKRFGGSFEDLLDYWNANKEEQYAALDRAEAEQSTASAEASDYPSSI